MRTATRSAASCAALIVLALAAPPAESITVGATVLTGVRCRFEHASPDSLEFGPMDPTTSKTVSLTIAYHCGGSVPSVTWSVNSGDAAKAARPGESAAAPPASLRFIKYSLNAPTPANPPRRAALSVTVSGTLLPRDAHEALPQSYGDTVVLTIAP